MKATVLNGEGKILGVCDHFVFPFNATEAARPRHIILTLSESVHLAWSFDAPWVVQHDTVNITVPTDTPAATFVDFDQAVAALALGGST